MIKLKNKLSNSFYIVLACVFLISCTPLDTIESSNKNPFIVSEITKVGEGLYKYGNNGDYCTGATVDRIITDQHFKIGDTIVFSNAR